MLVSCAIAFTQRLAPLEPVAFSKSSKESYTLVELTFLGYFKHWGARKLESHTLAPQCVV